MILGGKMKNILILCAVPETESERKVYDTISQIVKNYADNVSSTANGHYSNGSCKQRYDWACNKIKNADLVVAEMSHASMGRVAEVLKANVLEKPIIIFARKGSRMPEQIENFPAVKDIIFYKNPEDLVKKLYGMR